MANHRSSLDDKPGPLPDITSDGDSVTFEMPVVMPEPPVRLRVRCDARGEVWLSIEGQPHE